MWTLTRLLPFLLILIPGLWTPPHAMAGPVPAPVRAASPTLRAAHKPFRLPFDTPPGPATWSLGQLYGNTTGAYRLGDVWYAAGQGLHFGIDLIAPCGTPLVAIGDGEVVRADWLAHGAGPHNLVLRFPKEGVTALYGHLLKKPDLAAGQAVTGGQAIALSGDPDGTCKSRPHLHLEIRSPDLSAAYNPVEWIDADWDAMLLVGPFGDLNFARDLTDPLRWVRPEDQPAVHFGGPRLNGYQQGWPDKGADSQCVINSC